MFGAVWLENKARYLRMDDSWGSRESFHYLSNTKNFSRIHNRFCRNIHCTFDIEIRQREASFSQLLNLTIRHNIVIVDITNLISNKFDKSYNMRWTLCSNFIHFELRFMLPLWSKFNLYYFDKSITSKSKLIWNTPLYLKWLLYQQSIM